MIAEIRKHITTCVTTVDKKYVTATDNPYPNDNEVIETKLPYYYNITMGPTSTEQDLVDGTISQVQVSLKTYVQGHKNKIADFDEGYCQAILMDCTITDHSKIDSGFIMSVTSTGVTPVEVEDSQDVYAFESTFNFKLSYGIGE